MNNKRKMVVSVIAVIFVIVLVSSITYAYLVATTNESSLDTGSGELSINYQKPEDLNGNLVISTSRDNGLKAIASASLNEGSVDALFNLYITPKVLTNLNIPALKWEVEGIRNGNVVCSANGDFSDAVVDTKFKILDGCKLSTDTTMFTVYIWLDASLITTTVAGSQFDAKIGADSIPITGSF